jgi:hypothetical protein
MDINKEIPVPPPELMEVLLSDDGARAFYEGLTKGYKRRYCSWVADANEPAIRESRAQYALSRLRGKQKTLKIGSFMGNVGILQRIDDLPEMKEEIESLCESKSHKEVSKYGLQLAEHILRLTNTPLDDAMQACFDINIKWQEGTVKFHEARVVSDRLLQMAREEKDPARMKLLRFMGQVAAIPHVKRHALIASDYAVKLINLMYPGDMEEVRRERETQIKILKSC